MITASDILTFWFDEFSLSQHWVKDVSLDCNIKQRVSNLVAQASNNELCPWRGSSESAPVQRTGKAG